MTGVELLKCFRLKQQVSSLVHAFLGYRKWSLEEKLDVLKDVDFDPAVI